jgi:hypothetical protein
MTGELSVLLMGTVIVPANMLIDGNTMKPNCMPKTPLVSIQ